MLHEKSFARSRARVDGHLDVGELPIDTSGKRVSLGA
jgi:hypothetical protein